MALHRSSLLLRLAKGSSRRAAVQASCSPFVYGSSDYSDCRRCYSSSGQDKGTMASATGYHVSNGPSYMRGAVFWEKNKPLTFEDFHMPRPKANEVLIKTKACGVCHSDLHVIKGELPFASPCVVGHEITGEVVEHGPLTDSKIIERFPVGSHVVGAFIMPCGSCLFCSKANDLCESFFAYNRAKGTLYDGETRLFLRGSGKPVYMYSMGGLAEFCVVPAHGLAVLPNSLPYTESAILGCAVFTAYGAMAHAAEVRPGDAVAVIGIGGVGSSCLQIARAFGASEIIAVDVQDEKLQKAKISGATHAINALKEDAVMKIKEITGGRGVDIAVEALGRTQTFSQCVQSVRDGGKAVMIGLTLSGAKGEVDINHLVRRQIKVIGSYGGRARQDLPKLIKLAERGIFSLEAAVSRKCKFEEAGEAYKDLDQGKIIGRAVVEIM
ncbi:GroES-like zinc-binding alcohol dehydrogenase family protein [Striga hermonthica]|uniref:GroES-like zinc-binding alcohol dehydrogenase family protein n=1 Tax=Striga hermonthica TaxID=68872 RepID=A0A9N7NNU3_STRHE|nr:GroES-like zinc-binding alcohol dehydrogenase family protein [Striga hermonthica]